MLESQVEMLRPSQPPMLSQLPNQPPMLNQPPSQLLMLKEDEEIKFLEKHILIF